MISSGSSKKRAKLWGLPWSLNATPSPANRSAWLHVYLTGARHRGSSAATSAVAPGARDVAASGLLGSQPPGDLRREAPVGKAADWRLRRRQRLRTRANPVPTFAPARRVPRLTTNSRALLFRTAEVRFERLASEGVASPATAARKKRSGKNKPRDEPHLTHHLVGRVLKSPCRR